MESHAGFLMLIRTLHSLLSEKPALTLAVDGCCASGKTSLTGLLTACFDSRVISMDDFFLPSGLRTPQRLAQPGGNVHYERFEAEVIMPLLSHRTVVYRPFNCRIMDYADTVVLPPRALTIVEGSYSMRPEFRRAYDYTVFLSCSGERQTARIRRRNGEVMLQDFIRRWIPMENFYFEYYHIPEACDLRIVT